MALARVKTWIAGDVLTAADLNGEFNNVLNNPISLLSPTTGAINFNLSAHTNLVPGAVSASSGTAGQALTVSTAASPTAIWAAPTAPIASLSGLTSGQLIIGASSGGGTALGIGSTGQVLSVTSSNSNLVWGVIPLSGGLTSGAPVSGNIFYVSTSGVLTPLAIGTSAQVLTVSSGLPVWATPAAAAASGGGFTSSSVTYYDSFTFVTIGSVSLNPQTAAFQYVSEDATQAGVMALSTTRSGGITFPSVVSTGAMAIAPSNSTAVTNVLNLFLTSLQPDMTVNVLSPNIAGTRRIGMTAGSLDADPTNGVYFRATAAGSTWFAVSRNAGTSFTIATTAVNSSNFQTLRIQITSSGTSANVYTNTVLAGTAFTSSQLPALGTAMHFGFGFDTAASTGMVINSWQVIQNRPVTV